jgi:hypothetical protein
MWSLPYLLVVAFLFAPTLLALLFAASILEGHLLSDREAPPEPSDPSSGEPAD